MPETSPLSIVARGPRATVSTSIAVPIAVAWETFVPIALPDVFPKPKGPIPEVRGTSGQDGRWDVVGRSRSVHLGDGSTVREEVTHSDPSGGAPVSGDFATFGYRVSGFKGAIGLLAREAHGTWHFEQADGATTRVVWTYSFIPTSWIASVPLRCILATFWRSYMRDGLENVRLIVERRQRSSSKTAA